MNRSFRFSVFARALTSRSVVRTCVPVFSAVALTTSAHAWIGGFEPADGYQGFLNMTQNYNAGQYGPNGGYGGSAAPIAPNSGLWKAITGGFFSGGSVSYATGHANFDRVWVNSGGTSGSAADQGLVLTTGHEGWAANPLKYSYSLDSADLGGTAPAATGSSVVKMSFWTMGQLFGATTGGSVPNGYYGNEITFEDSLGNVGFRLGLTERASGDKVTYWDGSTLVESTLIGSSSRFDRWDVTLDLASDTFSANYFQFTTSTTFNLAVNQPMQNAMNNFTEMTFRTSPGVMNSKLNAVDDFAFHVDRVPAPSSAAILALGSVVAMRRRRH